MARVKGAAPSLSPHAKDEWAASRGLDARPNPLASGLSCGARHCGEPIPLAELQASGFISEIVPPDELEAAATRFTDILAARSPRALALTKRTVRAALNGSFDESMARELTAFREQMLSAGAAEGLAAFGARRAPRNVR